MLGRGLRVPSGDYQRMFYQILIEFHCRITVHIQLFGRKQVQNIKMNGHQ